MSLISSKLLVIYSKPKVVCKSVMNLSISTLCKISMHFHNRVAEFNVLLAFVFIYRLIDFVVLEDCLALIGGLTNWAFTCEISTQYAVRSIELVYKWISLRTVIFMALKYRLWMVC